MAAALDYALAGVGGDEEVGPIPAVLLAQARQDARDRVSLDTVLRRYIAGFALLGDFAIQASEKEGVSFKADDLRRVAADFNADGKADIVAAEAEGGSYSYRVGFSNGSGISSWSKVLGGMSQPTMLAVGDVSGDAKGDIIAPEAF